MREPDRDGREDDRFRVGRRPFLQSIGAAGAAGGIASATAGGVSADTPESWASGGDAYYSTLVDDLQNGEGLPPASFEIADTESAAWNTLFAQAGSSGQYGTVESLDVSGDSVPFSEARRIDVTDAPDANYPVQVRGDLNRDVSAGDTLLAVAYLRSSTDSPQAQFFAVDSGGFGNPSVGNGSPTIGSEWERHYFPIEIGADTVAADQDLYIQLQLGFKQQTVDIGGVALLDFGTNADFSQLPSGVVESSGSSGSYYDTLTGDLSALNLPEPGFVYSDTESGTWSTYEFGVGEYGTTESLDVSGDSVPFSQASRVSINGTQSNGYNANLRGDASGMAVEQGDVFLGVAYLRAPDGDAQVTYSAQESASASYNNWAEFTSPSIGSEWERFYFPIQYGTGDDAGNWWTEFWLAYNEQTVDIGGLALLDYSGTDVTVDDLPAGAASEVGTGGSGPEEWPQTDDPYYSGLIDYLQQRELDPGRLIYANNEADTFAGFELAGGETDKATRSSLDVGDNVPFSEATRIDVTESGTNAYSINLKNFVSDEGVSSGDVLLGVAYLRTPDEENAQVTYKVSENTNFANYVTKPNPPVTNEWQRFFFPVAFDSSYSAGNWWTEIWVGAQVQTVDIGGLALFTFEGNNSLEALPEWEQSPADGWEEEADARIQDHRTAEMAVDVVDENGDPVEGAEVSVSMQEHEFKFGAMTNAPQIANTQEGDPYRENRKDLFNAGVLENYHKWDFWENGQDTADAAVEWMEAQDWYIRGHVALWASVDSAAVPDDVVDAMAWDSDADAATPSEADSQYVRDETIAHVEDIVSYYGDRIDEWEVVNELIPEPGFVRSIHGADVTPEEAPILDEWFATAQEAGPDGQPLGINDYNTIEGPYSGRRTQYQTQIETVQNTDAGLDFVGLQSHFSESSSLLPSQTMSALDSYAEYDVPIRITEFDMSDENWPESEKADFFYQFLKTVFSHPSVEQFVVWGLIDTLHWRDDAPFYAAGWEEKPALDRYRNLVFDQWWTEESGTTDSDGRFTTNAFKGEYEVTVTHDGETVSRTVTLSDGGATVSVATNLSPVVQKYDSNGNSAVEVRELGRAATDFARGDLTISELSEVARLFASS
jgi:GH35 family endo-1,4-beta-xylanase